MTHSRTTALLAAAVVLAGCGEAAQPLEPEVSLALQSAGAPEIQIGGTWNLEYENFLHLSEDAARFIFGLEPEGTRTTLRCSFSGTSTLVQDGNTFTGSSDGSSVCVTTGGQVLQSSGGVVVVDGEILGRSVHFTSLDGVIECRVKGTIDALVGNVAVAKSGTHQCVEPGHPQSQWPAPPPRMGPNRSRWQAYR